MDEAGIETADLVRRCGMTRTTVKYWLDGTTKHLRPEHLFPVARALGINPEWLGTGEGPMRPPAGVAEERSAYVVQSLGRDERTLLARYAQLTPEQRRAVLELLTTMIGKKDD